MSLRNAVLFAALALALGAGTRSEAENLLQNPGFSQGLSGWTPSLYNHPGSIELVPTGGLGNSSALLFTTYYDGVTSLAQCVPVTPGTVYDASVWCRTHDIQQSCGIEVRLFADLAACEGPIEYGPQLSYNAYFGTLDGGYLLGAYGPPIVYGPPPETDDRKHLRFAPGPGLRAANVTVSHWNDPAIGGGAPDPATAHIDDPRLDPVVKGDLDNDDQADLVLRHQATKVFDLWRMEGTVRAQQWPLVPQPPVGPQELVAVDEFTGDEFSDLVFQDLASGQITLWPTRLGKAGVGQAGIVRIGDAEALDIQPGSNWRVGGAGMFGGPDTGQAPVLQDTADLVLRNLTTNKLKIWQLDGRHVVGIRTPSPDALSSSDWTLVGAGDYNRDGHGDLLLYSAVRQRLVTWYLDADLNRISGQITTPETVPWLFSDPGWRPVATADYGTGWLDTGTALGPGPAGTSDVVWRASSDGRLLVWHMDANSHLIDSKPTTPSAPADALDWRVVGPR